MLPDQVLPWPNPEFPLMFYHVKSFAENTHPGKSYFNVNEASKVEQMVTRLLKRGITPDRIGIITPYNGQKDYLVCLPIFCSYSLFLISRRDRLK